MNQHLTADNRDFSDYFTLHLADQHVVISFHSAI